MDFFFVILGILGVALSLKMVSRIDNSPTRNRKIALALATCVMFYGGLAILIGASI